MSGSEGQSPNIANINLSFIVQNTAQDNTSNTWGQVLVGQQTDGITTESRTKSEALSTIDQTGSPAVGLTYAKTSTTVESRRECVIEDDNESYPEELVFEELDFEGLAGTAKANSRDEGQNPGDKPLTMAQPQNSSSEEQDQPDSFETVEFGSKGRPRYKQQADAGFFHCGRLIGVPSGHHNQVLRGRTLLVLTVSNHGWAQCVCLCRHEDLNGMENKSFYRAHGAIYVNDSPPPRHFYRAEHEPFAAKMFDEEFKIKADCYINFEHTFTLNKEFMVASIGTVADKKRLLEVYQKVQKLMYERQVSKIEAGDE